MDTAQKFAIFGTTSFLGCIGGSENKYQTLEKGCVILKSTRSTFAMMLGHGPHGIDKVDAPGQVEAHTAKKLGTVGMRLC